MAPGAKSIVRDNSRFVVELMEVLYSSLRVNIKVTRPALVKAVANSPFFIPRTSSCVKLNVQSAGLINAAFAILAADEEYSDIGGAAVMHEWSFCSTVDQSAISMDLIARDDGGGFELSSESLRLVEGRPITCG